MVSSLLTPYRMPQASPKPVQAPVEGGFAADGFTVGETVGSVTCPAQGHPRHPPGRRIVFGAACRTGLDVLVASSPHTACGPDP